MTRSAALIAPLFLLLASCLSGGGDESYDPYEPESPAPAAQSELAEREVRLQTLALVDFCTRTGAQSCELCHAEYSASRAECMRSCASLARNTGDVSCAATCNFKDSCEYDCSRDEESCTRRDFRFVPIGERNPDIFDACQAAVAHDEACGEQNVLTACDTFSRIEQPEAADAYRCVSELQCGADSFSCFILLRRSSLGDQVADRCPSIARSQPLMDALDAVGSWELEETVEDLAACDEYCETHRFEDCIRAWLRVTRGEAGP
jgi:hypothetical protein